MNAIPELKYGKASLNVSQKYQLFYFSKKKPLKIINSVKGIILLHNSWTPLKYKTMTEQEFLREDILLSKLLKKLLEINI